MKRTFKAEIKFPGGLNWDFLAALESYLLSRLPATSAPTVRASQKDGKIHGQSFSELRNEVRDLDPTPWPIVGYFGSEPQVMVLVSDNTETHGSIDIEGPDEDVVLGLAASIRRRIDRGDLALPAHTSASASTPHNLKRTFKAEIKFPGGLNWDFLAALESYILSRLPDESASRVWATETDGKIHGHSFSELRNEVRNLDSSPWPIVGYFGSEPTVAVFVSEKTEADGSIDIEGPDEDVVLGLAASIRRRIDRGDLALPAHTSASASTPQNPATPPVTPPSLRLPESPVLSRPAPPSPRPPEVADGGPSLMRRAFKNPWFVGIIVGLVIVILLTVAIFLSVKYHYG
jgi:hypothetical protein